MGYKTIKNKKNFLEGPIPLIWFIKAAKLPGKALHVALALWYLAGLENSGEVYLSNRLINIFGVERHAGYRALKALEGAGLVSVQRHQGLSPRVTILEVRE